MNKLIWKGIDSSTIKGLLICELPPITKPKMRVQETEIDGVDGSIIEELGYETYDKSIKIGLTRNFDIDEVIAYFTGEGNVVFSNEPTKYYKAKILDQIDYERLLRFREATITFRVQPFKYEYQEEEQVTATGSIEETEVKITDVKAIQMQIDGRSTQDGIPTPTTPVEIESIGYENSFDIDNPSTKTNGTTWISNNGIGVLTNTGSWQGVYWEIKVKKGRTYTFKYNKRNSSNLYLYIHSYTDSSYTTISTKIVNDATGVEYTFIPDTEYLRLAFLTDVAVNNLEIPYPKLEKGSEAHSYIPYSKYGIEVETQSKNYLNVPNNYEVTHYEKIAINLPIGDYIITWEDIVTEGTVNSMLMYFYYEDDTTLAKYISPTYASKSLAFTTTKVIKSVNIYSQTTSDNSTDITTNFINLMISKDGGEYQSHQSNISLIVLDKPLRSLPNGVKDIAYIKNNKLYVDRKIIDMVIDTSQLVLIDTYTNISYAQITKPSDFIGKGNYLYQSLLCSCATVVEADNTDGWDSTNRINTLTSQPSTNSIWIGFSKGTTLEEMQSQLEGAIIQYELATPITEEYGEISILNLIDGENNISNSAETNMVVDYVDNKLIINNLGNYISKPIFEIEGAGTIKFILNGYSVFTYNFDEDGRVVIDSEKEDAYLGSVLKNRNMNGEFPKLEIGENKITWDGLVKNMSVVKKSRWL